MSKTKQSARVSSELPGMPEGNVPGPIREVAEAVVRLDMDIAKMKEDLKREHETLLDKMAKADIPVVIIVIDKWKYRIRAKTGKQKLVIEDAGMVEDKEKEPALAH